MTRPRRHARQAPPPEVAGGRPQQHISSIAHLFFSEEETEQGEVCAPQEGMRILVVGSGKASLAPNLAAGLAREIIGTGQKLDGEKRSGRDVSLRQVFLGEPSLVHFSAFSHLPAESFRPPRAEEPVPWQEHSGFPSVARVFFLEVPGEDFTAGRGQRRYFIRHMDLPGERELGGMEAQQSAGQRPDVARDGAQALIWCVTGDDGPSLQETSRLGRLLRMTRPEGLRVVLVRPDGRAGRERRDRMERLVRFVAGEIPLFWHVLGTDRQGRLDLQRDLARQLAP